MANGTAGSNDGTWLRWIVGILTTVILAMGAAWAKNVTDNQAAQSEKLESIGNRLTKIETALDIPTPVKRPGL